ncbi:MAG: hypothetical protein QGG36_01455 [Pirellulaceae bacterium]|jgi:anti-sigma factor RsiW|nr:hypothetical protein [Pirellulaceae bacterium]MDP7014445.1 hypothetical protein [Pirellulaceae bacterium]
MNSTPPHENPLDETLVAYLDGELSASRIDEVEKQLSDDPEFRQRLQELERAWTMLDDLPPSAANASFTNSTIEMVALTAAEDVQESGAAEKSRRWVFSLIGLAGLGAAATIGFAAAYSTLDTSNRQLLTDLDVIEHLDEYRYADRIEFLELLEQEEMFVDEEDDDAI